MITLTITICIQQLIREGEIVRLPYDATRNIQHALSLCVARVCQWQRRLGNNVKQVFVKYRSFDKVEQIGHVHSVSTLSKGRNFTKNSFDIVARNGNNVEVTFDFVERIVRLVAFDNVTSTVLIRHCYWCRTFTTISSTLQDHKNVVCHKPEL